MTQPKKQNPTRQHTVLLATDLKNSVLAEIDAGKTNRVAYTAYGQQSAQHVVITRLGFNGELREEKLDWYVLGNGYRAYNPRLMRFHSPDSLSPFGAGGLNSYAYCSNEPINSKDPSGHIRVKGTPTRSLSPQRPRTPTQPQRPSVIVPNPNYSTPENTPVTIKNSSKTTIALNPVAEPIATVKPSSTPRITEPKPSTSTAHLQASEFQGMPNLTTMIDPYQQPLSRGKRTMPTLPISATEPDIKKMSWLNPAVNLVRIS
jgi:RHS repeat-associated protein